MTGAVSVLGLCIRCYADPRQANEATSTRLITKHGRTRKRTPLCAAPHANDCAVQFGTVGRQGEQEPYEHNSPKISSTPMKGKLSSPLPRDALITLTIHRNRAFVHKRTEKRQHFTQQSKTITLSSTSWEEQRYRPLAFSY